MGIRETHLSAILSATACPKQPCSSASQHAAGIESLAYVPYKAARDCHASGSHATLTQPNAASRCWARPTGEQPGRRCLLPCSSLGIVLRPLQLTRSPLVPHCLHTFQLCQNACLSCRQPEPHMRRQQGCCVPRWIYKVSCIGTCSLAEWICHCAG